MAMEGSHLAVHCCRGPARALLRAAVGGAAQLPHSRAVVVRGAGQQAAVRRREGQVEDAGMVACGAQHECHVDSLWGWSN
jgi:hypothetical protein